MSDLHLEFGYPFDVPKLKEDKDTVLILAGDIAQSDDVLDYVRGVADRFLAVIAVFGNHEYYGGIYPDELMKAKKAFIDAPEDNIFLLENEYVEFDNICIMGGTLWSDTRSCTVAHGLNDYHQIGIQIPEDEYRSSTVKYRRIRTEDTSKAFDVTTKFLEETLKNFSMKPCVVVSHHAPSERSTHPRFYNDPMNPCFFTDLEGLMFRYKNLKLWIHGHMHNDSDYCVEGTRVVANPRGYGRPSEYHTGMMGELIPSGYYWENTLFNKYARINVIEEI